MSSHPISSDTTLGHAPLPTGSIPPSARMILKLLERMQRGSLTVTLPGGAAHRFGEGLPHAEIVLANWNVCDMALKNGDIGFGESYIAGDWSTPNLVALMDVMVGNRNDIEAVIYGKWWGKVFYRIKHLLNRNTRTGSRKNIHAHYDIGNAFYKLWLDPSMTYSSALFSALGGEGDDAETMQAAQDAKYRRILEQLNVAPGGQVLEIGCGWGGFAQAAAQSDLNVTGLTLSVEQLAYANDRMAATGLASAADLRLQDYRDSRGVYDGIASIEMFEAVGEQFWPSYFDTLKRSLTRPVSLPAAISFRRCRRISINAGGSSVRPITGQVGVASPGGSGVPGTSGTLAALIPRLAR